MIQGPQRKTHYMFANILLFVILVFFLAALCWAWQAKLDEVVRGMGRVIPSSQVKIIQNLEGGILSRVMVKEGETVTPGQALLQLDTTTFESGLGEKLSRKDALEAGIARLSAEYTGKKMNFPDYLQKQRPRLIERETALKRSRAENLSARMDIQTRTREKLNLEIREKQHQLDFLEKELTIAQKKYDILRPLVEKKSASRLELLDLERQINRLASQIQENRDRICGIRAAVAMAESKQQSHKKEFTASVLGDLTRYKNELDQLEKALPALQDRLKRTCILSPVSGLVKQIFVHTAGGVVGPGEPLMEIVPEKDERLVQARLLPKDIAFVHPGQPVKVKFTAYDFSIYGGMDGTLEHISADTIVADQGYSYFSIRVRLNDDHIAYQGRRLPVMTGMECQVDILSGSKTVMDYLLKPILKARQTALQEP